jgi:hypothetical protein
LCPLEELFPFALTGRRQRRWGWEDFDKGPSRWQRPVLKGFEGRRIVFLQSALELIEEHSAFFDQGDLIAAKQPQLSNERILFGESFPSVPIEPKGIRQTPGIQPIGLRPTGRFALPVGFAAHRGNRIEAHSAFQQLLDHQALAGLHTHREVIRPQRGHLFAPALPAFGSVLNGKVGHHLAAAIDDDHIVMIARPVETPVISNLLPCFHLSLSG